MNFPLRIKLYKDLLGVLQPEEKERAINYIRKKLEEKSAKNIFTEGDGIGYKGSTGNQRYGLLASVDRGKFILTEQNGKSRISYEFTFRQLFIITGIMSVLMGLLSQEWLFGLIGFSWLCGVNWLISIARHEDFLLDIKTGIDVLFFIEEMKELEEEKKQLPYEDNGKLKSWF